MTKIRNKILYLVINFLSKNNPVLRKLADEGIGLSQLVKDGKLSLSDVTECLHALRIRASFAQRNSEHNPTAEVLIPGPGVTAPSLDSESSLAIACSKKIAELLRHSRFDEAIILQKEFLLMFPKNTRGRLRLGHLLTKAGKFDEAVAVFLEVANTYVSQGFYLKAVAVYKEILKLDTEDTVTMKKLADIYEQLGLLYDAIDFRNKLAVIYEVRGDIAECIAQHRKIVACDPSNLKNQRLLASTLHKVHHFLESQTEYEKLLELANDRGDKELSASAAAELETIKENLVA